MGIIHHLCSEQDWQNASAGGEYHGRPGVDVDYIHCCTPEQLSEVAAALFDSYAGVLVLDIDEERVSSPVRYEERPCGIVYPHIYGPLNVDAVVEVRPYDSAQSEDVPRLSDSQAPLPESDDRPAL